MQEWLAAGPGLCGQWTARDAGCLPSESWAGRMPTVPSVSWGWVGRVAEHGHRLMSPQREPVWGQKPGVSRKEPKARQS